MGEMRIILPEKVKDVVGVASAEPPRGVASEQLPQEELDRVEGRLARQVGHGERSRMIESVQKQVFAIISER